LADLVEATGHKKAYFLDEALEKILPVLAQRFAEDLKSLRERKNAKFAHLNESSSPVSFAKIEETVSYVGKSTARRILAARVKKF
jgi:hypothetical protein